VRVQAAHGGYGQFTAGRAGRVRLGYRFGGRVQRGVLGEHLGQRGGAVRGRDAGGEDLHGHRAGDAVQVDNVGPGQVAAGAAGRGPHHRHPQIPGGGQRAGRLPVAVASDPHERAEDPVRDVAGQRAHSTGAPAWRSDPRGDYPVH
jgi:hypothetical protein